MLKNNRVRACVGVQYSEHIVIMCGTDKNMDIISHFSHGPPLGHMETMSRKYHGKRQGKTVVSHVRINDEKYESFIRKGEKNWIEK